MPPDVLLEGTPPGIDSADVETRIGEIDGVAGVHDLHVWTIGSDSRALSAHIFARRSSDQRGRRGSRDPAPCGPGALWH